MRIGENIRGSWPEMKHYRAGKTIYRRCKGSRRDLEDDRHRDEG